MFFFRYLSVLFLSLTLFDTWAADVDRFWNESIRPAYYPDREITEDQKVIQLEAPSRAADPAIVPITIKAGFPQSEQRFIQTITLFVDKNPVPFAGKFTFTPKSGRADLSLRIRVNAYSQVRAVAETNDGKLSMATQFVKASGGCSAPPGADLQAAMARLGRMKFKNPEAAVAKEPLLTQLMVSHPNITGLQMDQLTRLYIPPHFVKQVKVTFNGEQVLLAETDIAISENPSFRFFFIPDQAGVLEAEIIDSKDQRFTERYEIEVTES